MQKQTPIIQQPRPGMDHRFFASKTKTTLKSGISVPWRQLIMPV